MFCSHISSKTIKSDLCKTINSFSLQEAVAGVSGEEILFAVKETSNKKAIWNKEKRSSKDEVGIQNSSSESDTEIEFENDSGDDVSDGDAEYLFCTGLFSHDKHGEKWGSMCEVLSLGACRLWGSGSLLCVPHVQKKRKIVSYITKYLLSLIRTPFLF